MNYITRNKGITLVSLVVTIIILIILAGVTLSLVISNNGLITKAGDAKKIMTKDAIAEKIQTAYLLRTIENSTSQSSEEFKANLINELKSSKVIDDDTQIVNDYIVLDNENIISINTGKDAVIANTTEWEYMICDANEAEFCNVPFIVTGESDSDKVTVNATVHEVGNANNKIATIVGYKGSSSDITIPEIIIDNGEVIPVTRLGHHWSEKENFSSLNVSSITVLDNIKIVKPWIFYENPNITSVTLGNGVEVINDGAFYYCSNLKNVTIGNNVKWIGYNVFTGTSIENINLPDSLQILGMKVFDSCTKLKSIKIGNNVTTLGDACFRHCSNLESIQFNNKLTEISKECFAFDNSLKEINIPSNIKTIRQQAFMYVGHEYDDTHIGYGSGTPPKLEKIILNEGLQTLEFEAFTNAKSVKSDLRLPSTLTTIGTDVFQNFGLTGGGKLYKSDGTLYQ